MLKRNELLNTLREMLQRSLGDHTNANCAFTVSATLPLTSAPSNFALAFELEGELEGTITLCPEASISSQIFESTTLEDMPAAWLALFKVEGGPFSGIPLPALEGTKTRDRRITNLPPASHAPVGYLLNQDGPSLGVITVFFDHRLLSILNVQGSAGADLGSYLDAGLAGALPLARVIDVPLAVVLRFGQRRLTLREVLELNTGSLLELDRQVEEPVDLMLGERVIARGDVIIVDGNYGLRVTEVLESEPPRLSPVLRDAGRLPS